MLMYVASANNRRSLRGLVNALSASAMRVWGLFFLVSLASTWFIQLVLLTWLLPHWSEGNGLPQSWDVGAFHAVAVLQAQAISESGWQAWELRPQGWGVSGLLSAWYAVTVPSPWVFAPVQAVLFATGVSIVFALIRAVCEDRHLALIAVLPFLVFPSAAMLYAQPHRDIFVFCAVMLTLFGWWQLLRVQTESQWVRMLWLCIVAVLCIAIGFMLGFAVRRLAADLMQLVAVIMVVVSLLAVLLNGWQGRIVRWPAPLISVVATAMVAAVMLAGHQSSGYAHLTTVADTDDLDDRVMRTYAGSVAEPSDATSVAKAEETTRDVSAQSSANPADSSVEAIRDAVWYRSEVLPRRLDDSFRRLTGARNHLLIGYSHSRTLIDETVLFNSATDVLAYLPRAMQIGFLAPFPSQWLPHAEAPAFRNALRVLGGVEMALIYPLLPFLVYALWIWRSRPELWLLVLPAFAWVAVYAITVPMVGALVRYRYVALMLLVSLALAGLLHWIAKNRTRSAGGELDADVDQIKNHQEMSGVDHRASQT